MWHECVMNGESLCGMAYGLSISVELISLRRSLLKKSPIKETDLDCVESLCGMNVWNGIRAVYLS